MAYEQIKVDEGLLAEGIAVVSLNRPKQLNAITKQMLEELVDALKGLAKKKARVVILTGNGRAFSAGVDLTSAQEIFVSDADFEAPLMALEKFPGITIGAINGFAITGGFELALGCDLLIASDRAVFADTHAKWGIHPSWGLSQKLPKIIGPSRARLLSFTARKLDARTAKCITVARQVCDNHPRLVLRYKELSRDGFDMALGDGRAMEVRRAREYASSMTMEDFMEMQRFIASRKAKNKHRSKL